MPVEREVVGAVARGQREVEVLRPLRVGRRVDEEPGVLVVGAREVGAGASPGTAVRLDAWSQKVGLGRGARVVVLLRLVDDDAAGE